MNSVQPKPIPALYTVYILRSTVRHASLYIGSTPNPPRRLRQHNGDAQGGANRTSRKTLRPWEMVGLVSGFPSMVSALKFEWALTNSHLTAHIPSPSRLTVSTQRKANGQPRRPSASMASIISNLHLLLRVPSFSSWPLKLHFFVPEVYTTWQKWCTMSTERLRPSLPVVTDFERDAVLQQQQPASSVSSSVGEDIEMEQQQQTQVTPWGIHALPLDYKPMKEYVAKGHEIFEFEKEGNCVVCGEAVEADKGLHAICSNNRCEGVGHLSCWSRHLLAGEQQQDRDTSILPIEGQCPKCHGTVQWGDMMKELTLRLRGGKEVEKLLKTRRRRVAHKATAKATGKGRTKATETVKAKAAARGRKKAAKAMAESPRNVDGQEAGVVILD
ncbi:hypothetical protein B0H66DRAFT_144164 [Apodospora peruviana]|uniref:GIY-YIG domain-containing protein n=1 Tax=Apodospora peruviana TaxID=516989 RepID=A0AAE0MBU0_9PEZI|nr:hypothetical protein B0H66DRAFT_144164 [Apodospora peruviana]